MDEQGRKTIAVIGACTDRSKFGYKAVRSYLEHGWEVYPVNPNAAEIEGLKTYQSIADIPVKLDRVTLYLPPRSGVAALPQIAAARPGEFFVNPGAESDALLAEVRRLGLSPILACSIRDLGVSPARYPD